MERKHDDARVLYTYDIGGSNIFGLNSLAGGGSSPEELPKKYRQFLFGFDLEYFTGAIIWRRCPFFRGWGRVEGGHVRRFVD